MPKVQVQRFELRLMSMRCPRCQHNNGETARFCEECGTKLARACSACGQDVNPTAKFCPACGVPLTRQSEVQSPESQRV